MFGRPRCPVDPALKARVDDAFLACAEKNGLARLQKSVVRMPTHADFPEVGPEGVDLPALLRRVADHHEISADSVDLRVHEIAAAEDAAEEGEDESPLPVGAEILLLLEPGGRPTLHLSASLVDDPERLIPTLAVELSRVARLRETGASEADEVPTLPAEVAAYWAGYGVLRANARVKEGMGVQPQGYWWSPSPMPLDNAGAAYALAQYAWLRGEKKPAWRTALRPDMAILFGASLKYLHKTGDALLSPEREPSAAHADLQAVLSGGSDSARVHALWALGVDEGRFAGWEDAVRRHVDHDQASVRAVALDVIRRCALGGKEMESAVADAMVYDSGEVRPLALAAYVAICPSPERLQAEVLPLLRHEDLRLAASAAAALARSGMPPEDVVPGVVGALDRALHQGAAENLAPLLAALERLTGDAHGALTTSGLLDDPVHASDLETILESLRPAEDAAS